MTGMGHLANSLPATGADRTTGATDEQIDAAIQHWFASFGDKLSRIQTEGARDQRDAFRFAAEHLVPPGYAIVPESERLTPELRAAIGRAVSVIDTATEMCKSGMDPLDWDRQAIEVTTHYAFGLADALALCSADGRVLLRQAAEPTS